MKSTNYQPKIIARKDTQQNNFNDAYILHYMPSKAEFIGSDSPLNTLEFG